MVKKRELSYEERITVKILRENGHSCPRIAKVVGCHYSTCIRNPDIMNFEIYSNINIEHTRQHLSGLLWGILCNMGVAIFPGKLCALFY